MKCIPYCFYGSPRAHLHVMGMLFLFLTAELAHSFSFCSCVYFCLYGPFISIHEFSDNSSLSHSVLPVLFLPCWSFQLYLSLWKSPSTLVSVGSPSRERNVTVYVWDKNQPSLPTLYSVRMSVSVFMALSTVFHSINSPDNSPLSHFVLLVWFLPYWSFPLFISL